ncbi:MAG: hypothetical protein JO186_11725 [Actinobacteria bacterium]|nr:hypothetical protein [Actinomycetota bacterium]MBV8397090.1 hypothetical protein [Actinomycetota bacterium]MBV8598570.1 hypothetical protein [Actinomycetota bacterium]
MRFSLGGFAAGVAVIALIGAAAEVPTAVRAAHAAFTARGESWNSGEYGPSVAWETTEEVQNAIKTLPPNAVYTIVLGNQPPLSSFEQTGILPLFRYFLLPRRYTPRLRDAQWVITYHHSSETVGVPYKKEIPLGPDGNTFKVTR